jgi:predicted aconitase
VPKVGVHIETNRLPTILIDATEVIINHLLPRKKSTDKDDDDDDDQNKGIDSFFPVLGWICGNLSDGGVPLILGFDLLEVTNDHLKAFCAAFGTTGSGKCMYMHNAFQILSMTETNENYTYHEQPHYFTWRT